MATERKALRRLRGAAASALAALALVVVTQSPAHAEGEVTVAFSPPSAQVTIGGDNVAVTVTLTGTNPAATYDATVSVRMDGLDNAADFDLNGGANCPAASGRGIRCTIPPGQAGTFQIGISPATRSNLQGGQTVSGTLSVDVSLKEATTHQPGHASGQMGVTVVGNASGVPVVKGNLTDAEGKPVPEAAITVTDSDGTSWTTKTDANGNFQVAATGSKPIKPGAIKVKASKEGYADTEVDVTGVAGQEAKTKFSINPKTEATASDSAPPPTTPAAAPAAEDKDSGWTSGTWFLVILGVLFVGGGVAAIVLLLKRGKKDEEDEDLFSDKPPAHTPKAAQTGLPGVYDAGPRRPMMDAPTMIHNGPLIDDDDLARYGSGGAASPGFGPAYGADADQQRTQIFDPRGGVEPSSGAPTQMFDPRGGDQGGYRSPGYGEPDRGGYGQGGPADRGGYDGPPERGGYDRPYSSPPADPGYGRDDRGYAPPSSAPPHQGGYGHGGPADRGGYGPPPSQGGYDQRQPYDRPYSSPPAPPAQPSYEQDPRYDTRRDDRGGYDERYAPPPPPPPAPPAPPADPGYGRDDRYDDRGYDDRPRW